LQNAIDAMDEANIKDKKIHIDMRQQEHHIAIKIIDNGPGLPGENSSELTKPYVTHREKGTGLGLAIVAKIIEDHSGELVLGQEDKSDPLNGASVTMLFPHRLT
jgi:two-component system nitrogen regulation sensor histidine kinase NtrY